MRSTSPDESLVGGPEDAGGEGVLERRRQVGALRAELPAATQQRRQPPGHLLIALADDRAPAVGASTMVARAIRGSARRMPNRAARVVATCWGQGSSSVSPRAVSRTSRARRRTSSKSSRKQSSLLEKCL